MLLHCNEEAIKASIGADASIEAEAFIGVEAIIIKSRIASRRERVLRFSVAKGKFTSS